VGASEAIQHPEDDDVAALRVLFPDAGVIRREPDGTLVVAYFRLARGDSTMTLLSELAADVKRKRTSRMRAQAPRPVPTPIQRSADKPTGTYDGLNMAYRVAALTER
jgi:hypothetical protein